MKIALLEPFMAGSHAAWAEEFAARSRHRVRIFGLPGRHWKWRMHGGAVSLARAFLEAGFTPDLLLATDMLDLAGFLALTRDATAGCPAALYCHENQLTYPWSPADRDPGRRRDAHYAFINYQSALAADAVLFNSAYHRRSFLEALPGFLRGFPDFRETATIDRIRERSATLPLGLDLQRFDAFGEEPRRAAWQGPLILWNHRWEYDKNPQEFFEVLFRLAERELPFELAVLGESYCRKPQIFAEARERLQEHIVHWGFAESFAEYASWLWRADLLPVTAHHDFFGVSVVQAIYCRCLPLLPRRLAYPEHLDERYNPECFYRDSEELLARLTDFCHSGIPDAGDRLRQQVRARDWETMIRIYDENLEKIALGKLAFQR